MIALRPVETPRGNEAGLPDTYHVRRLVPDVLAHEAALHRTAQGSRYRLALLACGAIGAVGVLALAATAFTREAAPYARWGYTAAITMFLLSTAQAAPTLAFASRLGRGWWGGPLRRVADAGALAAVVTTPALLLLLWHLPDWHERPSIWQRWPGAPQVWDSMAILLLAALGLVVLWLDVLPDRDDGRTTASGNDASSSSLFVVRPARWWGAERQWRALGKGQILLGGLYLMLYAFVQLLVTSDMAVSLVPGWHSSVMPPYMVVTSLEGGAAFAVVALWAVRRWGRLERFVDHSPFHAASKILLALSLLWFYFFWAEFLTYWYGRMPDEQHLLQLLMFGPSFTPFLSAFLLSFVAPFLLLMWNPVRKSVRGVTLAAALILVGNVLDRVRLFVSAWSVAEDQVPRHLEVLPAAQMPGVLDVLVGIGLPAAVLALLLLAAGWVPPLSLWEVKASRLLKTEHRFMRTSVPLVAKPS